MALYKIYLALMAPSLVESFEESLIALLIHQL